MADAAVVITAGTGTSIDTRTESTNGNHRQVIILGDPDANDGVAPVDGVAGLKVNLGADNDITGTVTAELSAVDNAVLDTMAASLNTLDSVDYATQTTLAAIKAKTDNIPALGQALAAASVPVILPSATVTALTPPAAITGFATSAKQDTIIGHVDGVETLLGTIDADTSVLAATDFATEAKQDSIITAIGAIPGGGGVEYQNGDTGTTTNTGKVIVFDSDSTGTHLMVDVSDTNPLPTTITQIVAVNGNISIDDPITDDIPVSISGRASTATPSAVSADDDAQFIWLTRNGAVNIADSGGSITIDGTVTAELSAVDNAVLDTIAAKDFATQTTLAAINTKLVSGTDIGDVTINNGSGVNAVNIQDGGNTITVDGTVAVTNADITSIKTAVEVIDNAIAGSEMQVDIVGSLPAGTNAIGKLAANSGVDIGDVDVTSLPALAAGTNLIGRVSSSDETSTIYNGTTALTPKFAVIDHASSGDNTIVAAVNPKKIRVHQCVLNVAADVTIRFESGAGGTALTGQFQVKAGSGFVLPYSPIGWFETASNTLLNLELSGAVSVDGVLAYTEV